MVSIRWCLKNKNGLKIVNPNFNMSNSYLLMAEESISVLEGVSKSKIWTATVVYYIFYYSLYALMLRIGVKSEIHSCSLEFMKECLADFYSSEDIQVIDKAFSDRIDLQYYTNRPVDNDLIINTRQHCIDFFVKTKDIILKLNEKQIDLIRKRLV